MKTYTFNTPFPLESGETLPKMSIAYHTFGSLNAAKDNVVWVCHALTGSSDVADWWPHTVEKGCFLDPDRYFVICANIPGSHYGSTGPLSINPATGEPYYGDFPDLSIRDQVNALRMLADALDLNDIALLVGSSVGGFHALEWAVSQPERFRRLLLISTSPKASPWTIALDETQRMAILSDNTYGERRADAAFAGMAAARAIALLSYRGPLGYNLTQQDPPSSDDVPSSHRACTYQQYQGEKICRRFNVYSYMSILNAFDTHDVGRGRGGVKKALTRLRMPATVVGIATDICFTPDEMRELADMLPNSEYFEIQSQFGHDGFLVEHSQLNEILLKRTKFR